MAKVDLKITIHFKGENPNYRELSIVDMYENLEKIISDMNAPHGYAAICT